MHGYSPFKGKGIFEIYKNVVANKIAFKENLNPQAKSLILSILQRSSSKRPSLETILQHPYLKEPIVFHLNIGGIIKNNKVICRSARENVQSSSKSRGNFRQLLSSLKSDIMSLKYNSIKVPATDRSSPRVLKTPKLNKLSFSQSSKNTPRLNNDRSVSLQTQKHAGSKRIRLPNVVNTSYYHTSASNKIEKFRLNINGSFVNQSKQTETIKKLLNKPKIKLDEKPAKAPGNDVQNFLKRKLQFDGPYFS